MSIISNVIPNQNQKVYLKEQGSHKILHLKVETLAAANVKLLNAKNCCLFDFISKYSDFNLV